MIRIIALCLFVIARTADAQQTPAGPMPRPTAPSNPPGWFQPGIRQAVPQEAPRPRREYLRADNFEALFNAEASRRDFDIRASLGDCDYDTADAFPCRLRIGRISGGIVRGRSGTSVGFFAPEETGAEGRTELSQALIIVLALVMPEANETERQSAIATAEAAGLWRANPARIRPQIHRHRHAAGEVFNISY